jgi:5'-deoxynucleotidase
MLRNIMQAISLPTEEIINTGHLNRWHLVRVARQQNLSDHHYQVTMLAIKMAKICNPNMSKDDLLDMISCALVHDVPEVRLGDLPNNPYARALREKFGVSRSFDEELDKHFWKDVLPANTEIEFCDQNGFPYLMVKLADKLEALIFYALNGFERTYKDPNRKILLNCFQTMVKSLDTICKILDDQARHALVSWIITTCNEYVHPTNNQEIKSSILNLASRYEIMILPNQIEQH